MTEKKPQRIKCKNCRHEVWFNDLEEICKHKYMLHDDNCECRKPEPNWKPIQKLLSKEVDEMMKNHKPLPYDRSRGWDSISLEDKLRPFTI